MKGTWAAVRLSMSLSVINRCPTLRSVASSARRVAHPPDVWRERNMVSGCSNVLSAASAAVRFCGTCGRFQFGSVA